MKNRYLLIALLALVAVFGLAGGAFLLLSEETEPDLSSSDPTGVDTEDDLVDDSANQDTAPDEPASAQPPIALDLETKAGNDLPKTEPEAPAAKPEHSIWSITEYEIKIHGTVTRASDNTPIAGAEISAESTVVYSYSGSGKRPSFPPAPKVVGTATTDQAGKFEMTLKVKQFSLKLSESELLEFKARTGVYLIAKAVGYATEKSNRRSLAPDVDLEVNLRMSKPLMVSGRVIDKDSSKPIESARVLFRPVGRKDSSPKMLTTDADGRYQGEVPSVFYKLRAYADGYQTHWDKSGISQDSAVDGKLQIDDIKLEKQSSVSGIVVDALTGEPIEGAEVTLIASNGGSPLPGGSGFYSTPFKRTNEKGEFSFFAFDPNTDALRVRAAGYFEFNLQQIVLLAGKNLDVGKIELGHGLKITGIVTDPNGQGVAQAEVTLADPPSRNRDFFSSTKVHCTTVTDQHGNFEAKGLSEGNLILKVSATGFAKHEQTVSITANAVHLYITLSKGGSITGLLHDHLGEPVSGCTVGVVGKDSNEYKNYLKYKSGWTLRRVKGSTLSGSDGRFTTGNILGLYVLYAIGKTGSVVILEDVEVKDSIVDVGILKFKAPGRAEITLLEGGKPIVGAEVFNGGRYNKATTNKDGVAILEDLAVGAHSISTDYKPDTTRSNFTTYQTLGQLIIVAGKTAKLTHDFEPKTGVHLFGQLTTNGKNVFTSVDLYVKRRERSTKLSAVVGVDGRYDFWGLEQGTYELKAIIDREVPAAVAQITLYEDGDREFNRDFKGGTVSCTVFTPNNTPEERQLVQVNINRKKTIGDWGRGKNAVNAEGKFRLENVPEGDYRLTATLAGVGSVDQEFSIYDSSTIELVISIAATHGSLTVRIKGIVGKPNTAAHFCRVSLRMTDRAYRYSQGFSSTTIKKGAKLKSDLIKAGTYRVKVTISGYSTAVIEDVIVEAGEDTVADCTIEAASQLYVTFTNPEITEELVKDAKIEPLDSTDTVLPLEPDREQTGEFLKPTGKKLAVSYLPTKAEKVRIKIAGYLEFTVEVKTEPGTDNKKQVTLIPE